MISDSKNDKTIFDQFIESDGKDAIAANKLIGIFQRGFPIEYMQTLLSSSKIEVQRGGAFIAVELGKQRPDLAELLLPFIGNEDNWLNHYAMEKVWITGISLNDKYLKLVEAQAKSNNTTLRNDAMRILDAKRRL